MWRSNTAGPRIDSIACRSWRPNLVRRQVAVIATSGGPRCCVRGQSGNHNNPHRLHVGEDPVRLGLVASPPGPTAT